MAETKRRRIGRERESRGEEDGGGRGEKDEKEEKVRRKKAKGVGEERV